MKHEYTTWKSLLKWRKNDFYICGSSVLSVILIWIYLFFNESLENTLTYSNAEQYVYVAKHFYSVLNHRGLNDSGLLKNARILPITPIFLYLFHLLTLGNWTFAAFLYVISTAFLSSFLFYRLLLIFKISSALTNYYAIALAIYPISYVVYRSVVNSDSLYISLMCISLISVKISSFKTALVSTFLALLTNNQGIVLYLSIYIYLLYEKSKYNSWLLNFSFLFPIAFTLLGIIQYYYMNSFFAYFAQEFVYSDEYCPFVSIFLSCFEVDKLWMFHGSFMYYILGFIGILFLSMKSAFLAIHLTISFIYLILVKYNYIFHQEIQFEIFMILGLDEFLTTKSVRKILPIFSLIYGITSHLIAMRSIDYS